MPIIILLGPFELYPQATLRDFRDNLLRPAVAEALGVDKTFVSAFFPADLAGDHLEGDGDCQFGFACSGMYEQSPGRQDKADALRQRVSQVVVDCLREWFGIGEEQEVFPVDLNGANKARSGDSGRQGDDRMTQTDVMDADVVTATDIITVFHSVRRITVTMQVNESTGERETPQDLLDRLVTSREIPDDEEMGAFVDGEQVTPEGWATPIPKGAQTIEFVRAHGWIVPMNRG